MVQDSEWDSRQVAWDSSHDSRPLGESVHKIVKWQKIVFERYRTVQQVSVISHH